MASLFDSYEKPLVMGVLNVTPDSFSDGGLYLEPKKAVERALKMVEEGADIIDIGGESSGPGSHDVAVEEELSRIAPIFESLRRETKVLLSIDTYKAQVALHALNVGANIVNDVTAMRGDDDMLSSLAPYDAPIILMYSKDATARTTDEKREYTDVMADVKVFLKERIALCEKAGIARERIVIDPGMGAFVSSDPKYSLQLLKRLNELQEFGLPILVAASKKSFIGEILGVPVDQRAEGSLAVSTISVMNGAKIIRAHDVKETRRVVDMAWAVKNA